MRSSLPSGHYALMPRRDLATFAAFASCLLVPAVARAEPAWCKAATERINASPKDVYEATDADDAVYWIVGALCYSDADTKAEADKIEAARQSWSKKLGMTEADWVDAAEWSARSDRRSPSIYPSDPKAAWSTWSPIDQYAGLVNSTLGDSSRAVDPAYLADAFGARLTEVGRLGYIETCLGSRAEPVEWAICQPDIDAFDAAKFASELRTDPRGGFYRMAVRIRRHELTQALAERAEKVKALKAKDPGYAQMFTLAETARKDWGKTNPKLVELMTTMDEARVTNSRRASEGCGKRTWEAWKGVLGAFPAKQYSTIAPDPDFRETSFFEKALAMLVATPDG